MCRCHASWPRDTPVVSDHVGRDTSLTLTFVKDQLRSGVHRSYPSNHHVAPDDRRTPQSQQRDCLKSFAIAFLNNQDRMNNTASASGIAWSNVELFVGEICWAGDRLCRASPRDAHPAASSAGQLAA